MNIAISAVVGFVVAAVAMVGIVNAGQGDQKPVSQQDLYQYSSQ